MKVLIEMPEHIAGEVLERRQPGQSFEDVILETIMKGLQESGGQDMQDFLLDELLKATESVPSGVQYILSEIYSDWDNIDGNLKRVLGKKYRQSVESAGLAHWVRRRSDNHAIYFKP